LRKIIVSTLVTLDGVIEDPGGFGGFAHGDWAGPYFGEEAAQRSLAHLPHCDYFLCGRHTYEAFSKAWPNAYGPFADRAEQHSQVGRLNDPIRATELERKPSERRCDYRARQDQGGARWGVVSLNLSTGVTWWSGSAHRKNGTAGVAAYRSQPK
jgi:hypothetical protein